MVNPNIYGHFAEHLGRCIAGGIWVGEGSSIPNDGGIRLDTVEALAALELPVLRWPGGCFADNYHWRDGIGPRGSRPTQLNLWWLQGEDNAFGTHEFMRFCRMIKTEPYLCVNVGSGTVEEARSWVEYCNARQDTTLTRERAANGDPDPFNVRYWSVGNENWGCGGNMTPEQYGLLYRQFATYMRGTDKTATYVACGFNADWNARLLESLKGRGEGMVDLLSLHYYSGWGTSDTSYSDDDYYAVMTNVEGMSRELAVAGALCRAHSTNDHAIKITLDEWGTWFREASTERGLLQQSTMLDAVFAAASFNMFHRHAEDLAMTNMAQTVNVLQALVLTEGPRICRTPTYWIYEMYMPHRGGQTVPVEVRGPSLTLESGQTVPLVSASATVKEGALTLSLVNTDLNEPCTITAAVGATRVIGARVLTHDNVRAHNTPDEPDVVTPGTLATTLEDGMLKVTLPGHSVAVVVMEMAG
jgi:alpha-N-arabinofuranosidase